MNKSGMRIRMLGTVIVGFASLGLGACATSFTGSAHVENGRSGCETKCRGAGMEVAGMVYMGEYSSACVCEAPGATASGRRQWLLAAAASGGGAVGVVMQQRAQQQQNSYRY